MNVDNVRRIAIIGAGDMGHGIAACFLQYGFTVTLRDIEQKFIDRGVAGIRSSFERFISKGKMTQEEYNAAFSGLITEVDLNKAVKGADFIIEAIPEDLKLKQNLFSELDKYAPGHAI